jgi:prepilin signal peptidase PulO-like enzyme (type II secretory pathway)
MIFGSKKKRHANWPYRLSFLAMLFTAFMAVAISTLLTQPMSLDPLSRRLGFESTLLSRTFDVVSACWFFALGSCIGSFLNVVAYRLPLGISLTGYSRCPFCYVPIQTRDNVPVLGWIGLRGRCRACRLPIAPRYPIVEAIAGMIFLVVFLSELWLPSLAHYYPDYVGNSATFGRNLPYYRVAVMLAFLTWLFTIALIRFDNSPMPMGMAMLIAVFAVFIMPGILDFMKPFRGEVASMQQIVLGGLTRIGASGLAGLLLALVTQRFLPLRQPKVATTSIEKGSFVTAIERSEFRVESVAASDEREVNNVSGGGDQSEEIADKATSQDKVIELPILESAIEGGNRLGASHTWTLGLVIAGIVLGIFGAFTVVSIIAVLIGITAFVRPKCCRRQSVDPSFWLWLACLIYLVFVGALSRSAYWEMASQYLNTPYAIGVALAVIAIGFSLHRIVRSPASLKL